MDRERGSYGHNTKPPIIYEMPESNGGGKSEYHFRPSRNYLLFADKNMRIEEPRPDWWEQGNRLLEKKQRKAEKRKAKKRA